MMTSAGLDRFPREFSIFVTSHDGEPTENTAVTTRTQQRGVRNKKKDTVGDRKQEAAINTRKSDRATQLWLRSFRFYAVRGYSTTFAFLVLNLRRSSPSFKKSHLLIASLPKLLIVSEPCLSSTSRAYRPTPTTAPSINHAGQAHRYVPRPGGRDGRRCKIDQEGITRTSEANSVDQISRTWN